MQFMGKHEDHGMLGKLHNTFKELCYLNMGSWFFHLTVHLSIYLFPHEVKIWK